MIYHPECPFPQEPTKYDWRPKTKLNVHGFLIHAMSEYIYHEDKWKRFDEFLNDIGLSAHYFIMPDGTMIYGQGDDKEAYHAGKSSWKGLNGLNDYFLGAELIVPGKNLYMDFLKKLDTDWVSEAQYETLAYTIDQDMEEFEFDLDMVTTHDEASPGRKKDPGKGFDMDKLKSMI